MRLRLIACIPSWATTSKPIKRRYGYPGQSEPRSGGAESHLLAYINVLRMTACIGHPCEQPFSPQIGRGCLRAHVSIVMAALLTGSIVSEVFTVSVYFGHLFVTRKQLSFKTGSDESRHYILKCVGRFPEVAFFAVHVRTRSFL